MTNWLTETLDATATDLAAAGDWLTGEQRLEAWALARLGSDEAPSSTLLDEAGVEVVVKVATDPGRMFKRWADERIGVLGEEAYTELVGVTAMAKVIDSGDRALGRPVRPLPEPVEGSPTRIRPDDVGDVGAWVSQTIEKTRANVSRTLSLVPVTNTSWRAVVDRLYSRGMEFYDLAWDRPLSRPQVELVAARTTALQECFY